MVVVEEGDVHRQLLARAGAHELVLEAGDQPAGASSAVAAGASALELLPVDTTGEVHHHEVAVGRLALHGLEGRERLAHALQLGLQRLRVDARFAAATSTPL